MPDAILSEHFELTAPLREETMVLCHLATIEGAPEVLYRSRDPEKARRFFDVLEDVWDRGILARSLGWPTTAPDQPLFSMEAVQNGWSIMLSKRGPEFHELFFSKCPHDAVYALMGFRRAASIAAAH